MQSSQRCPGGNIDWRRLLSEIVKSGGQLLLLAAQATQLMAEGGQLLIDGAQVADLLVDGRQTIAGIAVRLQQHMQLRL